MKLGGQELVLRATIEKLAFLRAAIRFEGEIVINKLDFIFLVAANDLRFLEDRK